MASCTFTSEDATNLLTNSVKKKLEATGDFVPRKLSIRFLADNRVKVVITNKCYDMLPLDTVVIYEMKIGVPESSDDAQDESDDAEDGEEESKAASREPSLIFTPVSVKIGHLPMIFGLRKMSLRHVSQVFGTTLADVKRYSKSVSTDDGASKPVASAPAKEGEGQPSEGESKPAEAPAKSNGSITLGI